MSSRITSEHGSLGERVARMNGTNTPSPAKHVLARGDAGQWQPALLVQWVRHGNSWWGRVAMLDDGEPALVDLVAGLLRPTDCTCCQQKREPTA